MEAVKEFFSSADLMPMLSGWAVKIVIALVIYIIGKWIARRITTVLRKFFHGSNNPD
jgi:hypothetical protein